MGIMDRRFEQLLLALMTLFFGLLAWLAHCRSADPVILTAFLGLTTTFAGALTRDITGREAQRKTDKPVEEK